jgi:hypothetical protein
VASNETVSSTERIEYDFTGKGKFIHINATKVYTRVEVQLHLFLTSADYLGVASGDPSAFTGYTATGLGHDITL